jgi:hypothetical protein
MPNVNDLRRYLKADMVKTGDLVHFCDAGVIQSKDFKDKSTGTTSVKTVLEMEVMINDTMKRLVYSPNKTSCDLLAEAWGPETQNWVGKTGQVSIIEQLSFGKLIPVLVVKPLPSRPQIAPYPPPTPTNINQAASPRNAWEEEEYQEYLRQKNANGAKTPGQPG